MPLNLLKFVSFNVKLNKSLPFFIISKYSFKNLYHLGAVFVNEIFSLSSLIISSVFCMLKLLFSFVNINLLIIPFSRCFFFLHIL